MSAFWGRYKDVELALSRTYVTPLVWWMIANLSFVAWRYSRYEVFGAFALAWRVCLALFLALAWHTEPDIDTSLQDRALMKIKELLGGAAPVGGQITVAMHVDELPTAQAVRDLFEPVAAKHERFHKVPDHVGKYMWECTFKKPSYSYHVKDHVAERTSPLPIDEAVQALANEELPEGRPLWRFELLEGSDGKAVVMRVNHVTGDGLRLLKIGNKVLEFEDGSPATIAALEKMSKNKDKTWADKPSKFSILCDVLTAATMSLLPNETSDAFHAPGTIFDGAAPRAHVLRATVPLADVLAIRSRLAAGATLNDVILTAFCGAARNYASTVGRPGAANALVRALVAISMPDDRDRLDWETYNDFVMPSTKLPVFVEDRGRRLAEVQASMRALKKSRAGFIQAVIVAIFEKFGLEKLAGGAQRDVFAKHSLVYSNLPGYEKPVFFAKSKIAKFGVFFPNMISQVVFFSYDGTLSLSVSTDATYVTEPHLLNELFAAEVAAWKTELEKLD
ncbi:hypothetical protein AURANDRAFT_67590 [Aureococcus anophagefferens]|nr:hypothetical protein AURANDRAFT_67590 [Aureococcus anophagefferens]EGB03968.1 hypothetical protein AURANDRAFT_67590 [Aureococcus anophagefferens]|eukprot:XP_009041390.1 hypothetical protein AURANDRAFT_67590 [Aureococcus anophagefferens]